MFNKALRILIGKVKEYLFMLGRVDEIVIHGVKVNLNHQSISQDLKRVFYNGGYEGEEVCILQKFLRYDDIVMEVGAGVGFLSTFCAQRVGSERVFAYEANPMMIEKIAETYQLNRVSPTLSSVLLAEGNGEIDFYLENNFWTSSVIERTKGAQRIIVETRNINFDIRKINPSLLIIDIEGGEKDLIPIIDFHNIKKVIIEVHPHVIGDRETSKMIVLMINNGFNLNLLESKGIVLFFEKD